MGAIRLRDDQQEMIEAIRQSQRRHKSTLIQMPTGAGKTVVAAELARLIRARSEERRLWVAVHQHTLIDQWRDKLLSLGIAPADIGAVTAGCEVDDRPIQLCMYLTLYNRLMKGDLECPEFLFIDEAHRSRSSTFAEIIKAVRSRGGRVMGLSATPARTDGQGLGGDLYEDMVCGQGEGWLIDRGYLADYDMFSIPCGLNTRSVATRGGDYDRGQLGLASMDKDVMANVVETYGEHAVGRRTLIFAVNVEHALALQSSLEEAGHEAAVIHGRMSDDEKASAVGGFASGDVNILISINILNEGFDCPDADCVMLARKTQSIIVHKQQMGRGMRVKPDGGRLLILDLVGNTLRHGSPRTVHEWTLEDGCAASPRERNGFECAHCGYVHESPFEVCENCGKPASKAHRRIHEESAVKLERLSEEDLARVRLDKRLAGMRRNANGSVHKGARRAAWKSCGDSLFLKFYLAEELGYKEGAVYHMIREYDDPLYKPDRRYYEARARHRRMRSELNVT